MSGTELDLYARSGDEYRRVMTQCALYGDGPLELPVRDADTMLYKLSLRSARRRPLRRNPHRQARAHVDADVGRGAADLGAVVLARLDYEMVQPREPAESEVKQKRRRVYSTGWVSRARGDDCQYIEQRHILTTCSIVPALRTHGLVAKWRRLNEGEVHAHDLYQLRTKSGCDESPAPSEAQAPEQPFRRELQSS